MHKLERLSGTYNSYTIVVDVCLLVELILKFSMLVNRPRASISPASLQLSRGGTYWTPAGCNEVLLTVADTILSEWRCRREVEW
jgi:hypothetical protein